MMEIKYKILTPGCAPQISKKGDWVDLFTAKNVFLKGPEASTLKRKMVEGVETKTRNVEFSNTLIPLGIAMKLPQEFEAILAPRSSTYLKWNLLQTNSFGVIDNSFCGNNDEWQFPAVALKQQHIPAGTRLCQFRIQPSQNASIWTKIKWLFTNKITFKLVEDLGMEDRGGFGSTGQ